MPCATVFPSVVVISACRTLLKSNNSSFTDMLTEGSTSNDEEMGAQLAVEQCIQEVLDVTNIRLGRSFLETDWQEEYGFDPYNVFGGGICGVSGEQYYMYYSKQVDDLPFKCPELNTLEGESRETCLRAIIDLSMSDLIENWCTYECRLPKALEFMDKIESAMCWMDRDVPLKWNDKLVYRIQLRNHYARATKSYFVTEEFMKNALAPDLYRFHCFFVADSYHNLPRIWLRKNFCNDDHPPIFDSIGFVTLDVTYTHVPPEIVGDLVTEKQGYFVLRHQDGRQTIPVMTWEFMKEHFPAIHQNLLRKVVSDNKNCRYQENVTWHHLPPGAVTRSMARLELENTEVPIKSRHLGHAHTKVAYQQSPGCTKCMIYALCSALHHKGYAAEAEWIVQRCSEKGIHAGMPRGKYMQEFDRVVREAFKVHCKGNWQLQNDRPQSYGGRPPRKFHPTLSPRDDIVLVQLNSISNYLHCVAFVGNLLFDPSKGSAISITPYHLLRLCQGNIDRPFRWVKILRRKGGSPGVGV